MSKCILDQARSLEILQEHRCGLVRVEALSANLLRQRAVLIPAHVVKLHEKRTPRSTKRRASRQLDA